MMGPVPRDHRRRDVRDLQACVRDGEVVRRLERVRLCVCASAPQRPSRVEGREERVGVAFADDLQQVDVVSYDGNSMCGFPTRE